MFVTLAGLFSLLHPWVKSADTDFITIPDATFNETAETVRLGVGEWRVAQIWDCPYPSGGSQDNLDVRMRPWMTTQMAPRSLPRG